MVGFTFAYGSMFAKVWVVYRMGASENQEVASRQTTDEVSLIYHSAVFICLKKRRLLRNSERAIIFNALLIVLKVRCCCN